MIRDEVKKTNEYKEFIKALKTKDTKTAKDIYLKTITNIVLRYLDKTLNVDSKSPIERYIN
ncbi:MAG TPA: hypothetical protein ENG63_07135 [Candidatus Desulfofervidus auxilii]|uniref:Uncharacterized protein n=1 Tax=Desulfofervidus auxilii TaxID=1621989 RepID=A0A7C0U3E6_DESA2|nr:hypothetical protein [Candidatus Desulfofervidus auxilii]